MKIIPILFVFSFNYYFSFGQCVTRSQLDTACTSGVIQLPTTGLEKNVLWDFNPGDFFTDPISRSLGVFNDAVQAQKITLVYDSLVWHGFLPGKTKMYHFIFNDSLTKIIQTTLLDVYGGFGSRPSDISFVKQNGNWYGFGVFINGKKIIRFDFGNSLMNTPIPVDFGTLGGLNVSQGMDMIKFNGEYILAIVNQNSKKITMVNLGADVSVMPDPSTSVKDLPGPAVSYQGIKFVQECNNWYAIVVAFNQNVYRYSFGNSIFNTPTIEDLTPSLNPSFPGPTDVSITFDRGKFLALISTNRAQIYALDFGRSMSNEPTNYKITSVASGMAQSYGIELVRTNSLSRAFFLNSVTKELFVCEFKNTPHGSSISESNEILPSNLYYASSGWKYLQEEITQNNGQKVYRFDSIFISSSPKIDLIIDKSCNYDTTVFKDQSNASSGIANWLWIFGSTDSSTTQNTSYYFANAGWKNIQHRITDFNGCTSDTLISLYIADSMDITPDFQITNAPCTYSPIQFDDLSTFTKDSTKAWHWNFDGIGTSDIQNPTFVFAQEKSYNIALQTIGKSGCSRLVTKQISLISGPNVQFDFTGTCSDELFSFANSSSGTGITGYSWDFGDGYFSSVAEPEHRYDTAGNYLVALSVSNNQGCNTKLEKVLPVRYRPQANFTNDLACSGNEVTFFDQSVVTDANITENQWTLRNEALGYLETSSGSSPILTLAGPGMYQVMLTAKSNYGCVDTLYRDINVYESPVADFDINNTCFGDSAMFSQQVQLPAGTQLISTDWLVNSTLLSGEQVRYQADQPGDYTVEMFVRASNLCPGNTSKSMKIAPLPTLDFGLSDQCEDKDVMISAMVNSPADPVKDYRWTINQKPVSFEDQFYYSFKKAKDYLVNLDVTTQNNCQNSMEKSVTIHPAPQAGFDVFPSFGANPLHVQFTDQSSDAQRIRYYFSNHNTDESVEPNPEYTYTQIGDDLARQVVENEFGCRDTAFQNISVVEPVYDISITNITMDRSGNVLTFHAGLQNNGTIIINNPVIKVDIAQQSSLLHTVETSLLPGESGVYNMDFELLRKAGSPIDYVCFSINTMLGAYEDVQPNDNAQCVNIDQQFNLLEPYPNPSKNFVLVPVVLLGVNHCELQLTDEGGRMVYRKNFTGLQAGLNEIEIDLTPYRSGIYLVTIKSDEFTDTKKIVIR